MKWELIEGRACLNLTSGGLPHGDEKGKNIEYSVKEAARKDKNFNVF